MDINKAAFDGLDPEVMERVTSRRDALRTAGGMGANLAIAASVPLAVGLMAKRAFAQGGLPQQIADVLNFALTLEYLEADFYNRGLAANGLIPAGGRDIYQQIAKHENAHVALLQSVLGDQAVDEPNFDFTAGGMFPDVFTNYQTFLLLSQAFEDTGVRAYKGQAGNLISNDAILTAALRIHSVEARHASVVRRLRGLQGWIPFEQPGAPAPVRPVYQGESNMSHLGISLPNVVSILVGSEELTEAYDEPLTVQQVLAIAGPFIES